MKKLVGDAKLEESRSYALPIQNMMSFNRLLDFGGQKRREFLYSDTTVRRVMLKEAERVMLGLPPRPPAPAALTAAAATAAPAVLSAAHAIVAAAPAVVVAALAVVAAALAVIASASSRGGKLKSRYSGATPRARKPPAAESEGVTRVPERGLGCGIRRMPGLRRFSPEARRNEETPCCAKIVLFQIDKEIEPAPVFSCLLLVLSSTLLMDTGDNQA
jgi:hypothetical protein